MNQELLSKLGKEVERMNGSPRSQVGIVTSPSVEDAVETLNFYLNLISCNEMQSLVWNFNFYAGTPFGNSIQICRKDK